ncbi:unnamed protein product [Cyprideis torosa]|uniref:Uncharacterized protein n=1 Tax=Cyprideis torosa TaxID=163714 RepID=A0A7R8WHK3_9CRUS|nr:unnamed protein product [Cyprideis torosa]CAG0896727.1 unnamed protein product [Cyprideis torosa]
MLQITVLVTLFAISYGAGPPAYGHQEQYPDTPPNYQYAYAVKDDYSGTDFEQSESRKEYDTNGYWRVKLPDGRVQTVKYADQGNGNVAEVSYEGEARYDEYKPKAQAYSAQPTYSRPVYKAPAYAPRKYQ